MINVNFVILGRLGNAIFRYMASALICLNYNGNYVVNYTQNKGLTDNMFYNIFVNKCYVHLSSVNMEGYYQHDSIYKENKEKIKNYILNNPNHVIFTDGVKAGDSNIQKFFMTDILITPKNFSKKYDFVIHIRLEDFVTYNFFIKKERIIELLKNIKLNNTVCIVCNMPETKFEVEYISTICDFLKKNDINVIIENNDVLTDYHIMKESKTLVCSNSTLSWCAAFFSESIELCYFPDYEVTQPDSMTCKNPINNTVLY